MILNDVNRIWDRGGHNAFTSLVRTAGQWFCSFREATDHHSGDGTVRVLSSSDGRDWNSRASIERSGWDLRDPKLSVRSDGALLLYVGGRGPERTLRTFVYVSADGEQWRAAGSAGDDQYWLWGVTWTESQAFGVGYTVRDRFATRLYRSEDGIDFSVVVPELFARGRPNEATVLFQPNGIGLCLLRRDAEAPSAQLGIAPPPYTRWEWKDLGVRIGGPAMVRLPDGRIAVGTRLYDGDVRTSLCLLDADAGILAERLPLPSGGDTSYPGLVVHEGVLWVSYYSSHEGKTSVYIAAVDVS